MRWKTVPMANSLEEDPACAVAHGEPVPDAADDRALVAVFASPVADCLLRLGTELGYRGILLEPDAERAAEAAEAAGRAPGGTAEGGGTGGRIEVVTAPPANLDGTADVVVTDHHRPELGTVLRDLLQWPVRWIGVMGTPRHAGPHVRLLTELGVPESEIARVHRPIGLNIGSRTPPEIALSALAGLIADRNGRPGGFTF